MQYNNDFYRVYYFVVSSTNTIYNVGGFTIARACGPFAEPGHFGIFIGLVLAIEKLLWNKTSKLPIIAGFLTFSPAFYIILLFIITYDIIFKKNFKPFIVLSSVLIIVFSLLLSDRDLREPIMFLAWNRNFAEGRSILDDRSRHYTINAYENFIKKPNIISGKGTHYVNNIGVLSDPRGMIFKFGLIGASITILILFIIFRMANRRTLFLLLPIVILIYFHRSWMFESPYIYLLVFLGISSVSLLEEFDDKDKKKQVYPKPV